MIQHGHIAKRSLTSIAILIFCLCLFTPPPRASAAQAIVPIVAYNPTYRLILGGAYFLFPAESEGDGNANGNGSSYGIQLLGTFDNNIKIAPEYKVLKGPVQFELQGQWSTFYDPYYGEGADTRVDDYVELDEESGRLTTSLTYKFLETISTGPVYEMRYRQNRGIDGDPNRSLIASERAAGIGWKLTLDRRNSAFSTKTGNYFSLLYFMVPAFGNSEHQTFQLITTDARQFFTFEPFTFAFRMAGGMSSADTGYLYRFRLGGTDALRGYYPNRFRGSNFALGQVEIRWEILKALSLVAFTDIGNVGDPVIRSIKQTYGGGIRFGLPPDWLKKARLDFAYSKDQSGVSFVFDETF